MDKVAFSCSGMASAMPVEKDLIEQALKFPEVEPKP